MPRGVPHGYFNKSDKPARALFWVAPTQKLEALFDKLHNLADPAEVVRISADHEVNFLPRKRTTSFLYSASRTRTQSRTAMMIGPRSGWTAVLLLALTA